MEKFINFGGWVALGLSLLVRFVWTWMHDADFASFKYVQEWELWLYGISVAWFCLSIWNVFIRTRCPKCDSANVSYRGTEELDRWVGTKKVTESMGNGKTASRAVSTTFEKVREHYNCIDCGHPFAGPVKQREKTA